MKRFCLILLSLGLILVFSTAALAVDVKFSGEFYAAGMYLDKTSFTQGTSDDNISTAFYYQRLRVRTDFVVSPGLSLVTRFDAMERIWGGARTQPGYGINDFLPYISSAGTTAENENIAFDWAYIQYASPIGVFTVGYQPDGGWGTVFADNQENGFPVGKIGWALTSGGFTGSIQIAKILDLSKSAVFPVNYGTDVDIDKYSADIKYAWNSGEAGLRAFYLRQAATKIIFKSDIYGVIPYAKAKFGPVTIQAELDYYWGDVIKWEVPVPISDIKMQNIGAFVDAVADFNMFYAGGTFAYVSGDDANTTDKLEGGLLTGGVDWNPCLLLWNYDRTKWAGYISDWNSPLGNGSAMSNAWFFQGRVGVRPVAGLAIQASLSYALADQKNTTFYGLIRNPHDSNAYGTEVDLTATYKITNNLTYMIGVGYLFTGDYFKGSDNTNSVRDDYILTNKLTLTF